MRVFPVPSKQKIKSQEISGEYLARSMTATGQTLIESIHRPCDPQPPPPFPANPIEKWGYLAGGITATQQTLSEGMHPPCAPPPPPGPKTRDQWGNPFTPHKTQTKQWELPGKRDLQPPDRPSVTACIPPVTPPPRPQNKRATGQPFSEGIHSPCDPLPCPTKPQGSSGRYLARGITAARQTLSEAYTPL